MEKSLLIDFGPEETVDTLKKWHLKVIQGAKGYRFSIDPILLANLVHPPHKGKTLDLGAGCGILGLILARIHRDITITGVEIQPQLATRARRNVALNNLEDRIEILEGSYSHIKNHLPESSFHYVITNPPYRKLGTGRINPLKEKAIARHELHGGLEALMKAVHHVLMPKGKLGIIFTATRAVDLIHLCRSHKIEPKCVRFIHPYPDHEAQSIFVEGFKGGKEGEVRIEPPLIIYTAPGIYSPQVAQILGEGSKEG